MEKIYLSRVGEKQNARDDQEVENFLHKFKPKQDCTFYADDWYTYTEKILNCICNIALANPKIQFVFETNTPLIFPLKELQNFRINLVQDGHASNTWKKIKNKANNLFVSKSFDNICCPTGSFNFPRIFLILALHYHKLWHNDYCSQPFTFTINDLRYIKNYKKLLHNNQIKKIGMEKNSWHYTRYNHANNFTTLYKKHRKSFISIVSETQSHHPEPGIIDQPHLTEKIFYPILAKSIWIGYSSPLWHFMLEKFYGFKLFYNIFKYDFDKFTFYTERALDVVSQVKKLHDLSYHDKKNIYKSCSKILDYNYEHFVSGKWQNHLLDQWKKYKDDNFAIDMFLKRS